nr:hypothetical protein [Tanacetum cinerariifolium]
MKFSFGSLKQSVINISYAITNKAFQVSKDPSGLESSFNSMYKFLAPCHILISPKMRIHTRVEPIDLVFLNSEIWCFQNVRQCTITGFVNLIKPHDLSFIVINREHNCTRRINDCVVVLVLEAFSISSWFSKIQLFLCDLFQVVVSIAREGFYANNTEYTHLFGHGDLIIPLHSGLIISLHSGLINTPHSDKMVDENILASAPTRSDDQILPFAVWVPIGKRNFVLDLHKKQRNLIF